MMIPKNVLYYGKNEPLPERTELHAGPLRMFYENGDLRTICWGEHEVLRRVYAAVRDQNWGTVPPILTHLQMQINDDSFQISYEVENKQGEIDFAWQGLITGNGLGTVEFRMKGIARSTFLRNRIGWCVLHPASCAGADCTVEHVDGSREKGCLPILISPDQPVPPFAEMSAMAHQVAPGLWAEVHFSGDIFEMEDQRNWTDASFKTFSTPLRLPSPVEIQAGTTVEQSLLLCLRDERPAHPFPAQARQPEDELIYLSVQRNAPPLPIPSIGLCAASHAQPLSKREIQRLDGLHLNHLRVDLRLEEAGNSDRLARAAGEAEALGIPLDIALLLSKDGEGEMDEFMSHLDRIHPRVRTWLIYPRQELFGGGSPTRQVVELARKRLDAWSPLAKFAAGTNTDLIFLQRTSPPCEHLDAVAFAINPQVHAFDNTSLVETLETQGVAVASAQRLARGLPVMVSPVTLKPRFNPYAAGPEPKPQPGELPSQVDIRQMSLLGAGWTLGSLKSLALGGASSITYFETSGWRGVMETEWGSPLPEIFRSIPGGAFPLYSVLAEVGEFAGGEIIACHSTQPHAVDGMILRNENRLRLLLANYTGERQAVMLPALGKAGRIRRLDETNVEEYMYSPEAYHSMTSEPNQADVEGFRIHLQPYGLGCVELTSSYMPVL